MDRTQFRSFSRCLAAAASFSAARRALTASSADAIGCGRVPLAESEHIRLVSHAAYGLAAVLSTLSRLKCVLAEDQVDIRRALGLTALVSAA